MTSMNVIDVINEGIQTINGVYLNLFDRSKHKSTFQWKSDDKTLSIISDIKEISKTLSNTCLKLNFLVQQNVTMEIYQPLLKEINDLVILFITKYLELSTQSISECLLRYYKTIYRSYLTHISDVLQQFHTITNLVYATSIHSEERDSMLESFTMQLGMVTKINDELQTMPQGNKIAFRRFVMEVSDVIHCSCIHKMSTHIMYILFWIVSNT